MPFKFLIYLQPTHYFRLFSKAGMSVFPKVSELPDVVLNQLQLDSGYMSQLARDYDLSWQAIQKGYIGGVTRYTHFENVPLEDEYRFIKKQFHPVWVFYVLCLRLISFHNPIKEIKAWVTSSKIKRVTSLVAFAYPDWKNFKSHLKEQAPMVSVIIPTLNRYDYLKAVLEDFEKQDYKNFEILIVDQSEPFRPDFYTDFELAINLIRQEEKALWLARNTAIKNAQGDLIALSEDDVRIEPNWISSHLKCLDFFKAKVSAGVFYPEGNEIPKERAFFAIASQFATGNAMLYKSVFQQVGLFDRQYEKQRMGDGEFGLRVYLEDIKSVSNPYASCVDVKAPVGGLRINGGSWDAWRPKNVMGPRPVPSVLYFSRKYFGNKSTLLLILNSILPSIVPYQFKHNKLLKVASIVLLPILLPLLCIQVFQSWRQASIKLKQGSIIDAF